MLTFGSEICGDLPGADQREWLVTNGLGSYAMGTVSGALGRSYHGLLVAALEPPVARTLLVSKLEETVRYGGQSESAQTALLSTNHWVDGGTDPHGYRLIESFALEGTVPRWRYGVADALLEKRIWMAQGSHTTYVQYRLLRGSAPLILTVRAFVRHRSHHGGSDHAALKLKPVNRGLRVCPPVGAPFFLLSDRGVCRIVAPPRWVEGLQLEAEARRGLVATTDHLDAGWLEVGLSEAQPSLTFVASTDPHPPLDGERALAERHSYERQLLDRWETAQPQLATTAPAWITQLVLAADAFVVERPLPGAHGQADGRANGRADGPGVAGASLIAGYPWFNDWGRDTMISLAGLTLRTGRPEVGERILRSFARFLRHGLIPNRFPDQGEEELADSAYNTVDGTLWFFQALADHYAATGCGALIRDLFPQLEAIIEHHVAGTLFAIRMDAADGLLSAGAGETQLTWMDAKPADRAITPRHGKAVEVNALWINALRHMAAFSRLCEAEPGYYDGLAERAARSFERFWNAERGYCFDVLDGPEGRPDPCLRPNQLLALSLGERLLREEQERSVLAICSQRLLTRHGLRSLDPLDPEYRGQYGGDVFQRDAAYHQGTVWGWWLGPFALAHARIHADPAGALSFLEPMAQHLSGAGLGSISEIFDGDAPHQPRGCPAQAWSVAEVLRAWVEISAMRRSEQREQQ